MTDAVIRALEFYHHDYIPIGGSPKGEHFVRLHGVISDEDFVKLKDWLSNDAPTSNASGDKEPPP